MRSRTICKPDAIEFTIRVGVVSEANQREHWAVKNRRKKEQQQECFLTLCQIDRPTGPLRITLTRRMGLDALGRKNTRRMDTDNLAGSFKHCADAIAKWLRRDDGDPSLTWVYDQVEHPKKEVAVRIDRPARR